MIHTDPAAFLAGVKALKPPHRDARPTMSAAMLVSPSAMALSAEAASDNAYMDLGQRIDPARAVAQHLGLIAKLGEVGVPVLVFPGVPGQPDGAFVNNAYGVSYNRLIRGAMRHPDRQGETRRKDIQDFFVETLGFEMSGLWGDAVGELTGVVVIDRLREVGLLGRSSRVNEAGVSAVAGQFGLRHTLVFDLAPGEYHTNMVLSLLAAKAAILHAPSLLEPAIPGVLREIYGGQVLELTDAEKDAFAGNCLAVTPTDLFFSARALDALRPTSKATLEGFGFKLHGIALDEIEKAGGSLRCLIAEFI